MMKYSSSFQMSASRATIGNFLLVGMCSVFVGACTEKEKPQPIPAPEPSQSEPEKVAPPLSLGHRYPVGPQLIFVPGKGAGAIRFGATVETIERHMDGPCEKKTQDRCLYARAAVEFFLTDGKLSRVKAHRRDRKVSDPAPGKDQYFGSLAGIVQPRIMLGLHRHVVVEEFGEPAKKEEISPPGPDGLVDRHYYEGIVFEYDKIENGNVVLSAIEILPSDAPYQPPMPEPHSEPGTKTTAPPGSKVAPKAKGVR